MVSPGVGLVAELAAGGGAEFDGIDGRCAIYMNPALT